MATVVIKGRQVVWGIVAGAGDTHATGIITRIRDATNGGEDFVLDDDGFEISWIFYGDYDELEVDLICEAATAKPARGDAITIAGVEGKVQSCELLWEQKTTKKLKIKARYYPNLVDA